MQAKPRVITTALLLACAAFQMPAQRQRSQIVTDFSGESSIALSGPGVTVTFQRTGNRLALSQIERRGQAPLLYRERTVSTPGAGPVGNPLAVVINEGTFKGVYGMSTFKLTGVQQTPERLLAYLAHDTLPMMAGLEIRVDGSVVHWYGQVVWNGDEAVEADVYFPLLSRVKFDSPARDRAIFAQTSGSVRRPLGEINYSNTYIGRLSSPTFLVEGGGRGLAVLDDNRADFAADPIGSSRRNYVVANQFPPPDSAATTLANSGITQLGGEDGPYVGVRHTRVFQPKSAFGGVEEYRKAEGPQDLLIQKYGDGIDLGPVRTYLYAGNWKKGALWLRGQRRFAPMRVSPEWFRRMTYLGESGWGSFRNLHRDFEGQRERGTDLFFIGGFSEPEVFGAPQSRGDYTIPSEVEGGIDTLRRNVESVHLAGGRFMLYVEGMIVWKRSRIGRSERAKNWALLEKDGRPTEHYRGFWHACPASADYQEWLAKTLAEIVKTANVDGFFIDSTAATYNHRCFNPAHNHPHPDVWNWGVRQMFGRIREELDKVKPESVIFVEGEADIAREYADAFLSHTHRWTDFTFTEPFTRFLHPEMRAFESWGGGGIPEGARRFIFNSVNGIRIYFQGPSSMIPYTSRTRRYYNVFPEICESQMSSLDVQCENCISQMFDAPYPVITVGNDTEKPAEATITIPIDATVLFDRLTQTRIPVVDGKAKLALEPFDFKAFELRP